MRHLNIVPAVAYRLLHQNMRYRPRGEGHGQGPGGSKAPIGAHAGEVKGGTIDWGHMSTRLDQFGSKGYDLLADEPSRPVEATVGMHQQGGCCAV